MPVIMAYSNKKAVLSQGNRAIPQLFFSVRSSQMTFIPEVDRLNSFGRQCFAVAGPLTWNSLPVSLRDPTLSLNIFRRQLKTYFFVRY